MKTGIQRIVITDKPKGQGAWRFEESKKRWSLAEKIYREIFKTINPLLPGVEYLKMTQAEFDAGYDKFFGVDIILNHESGMVSTLQEKILFTSFQTITVEYMNDPNKDEQGDWFNLRVDYYFVGYDRGKKAESIQEWMLLDWRKIKELTGNGSIKWRQRENQEDGALASFRYIPFSDIPRGCVVSCLYNPETKFYGSKMSEHQRTQKLTQTIRQANESGMCAVCHVKPQEIRPDGSISMTCGDPVCHRSWLLPNRSKVSSSIEAKEQ